MQTIQATTNPAISSTVAAAVANRLRVIAPNPSRVQPAVHLPGTLAVDGAAPVVEVAAQPGGLPAGVSTLAGRPLASPHLAVAR